MTSIIIILTMMNNDFNHVRVEHATESIVIYFVRVYRVYLYADLSIILLKSVWN